jgi:hypothetical protein
MKRITWSFLLLVSLFLVLSLAGCWNPFKPDSKDKPPINPPQEELVPRTTPQNVLTDLRIVYSIRDNTLNTPQDAHTLADEYRKLLHTDFKFYFLPADVPQGLPDNYWRKDDEAASFDTLQTKRALGIVNEIQLTWTLGSAIPDNRTDPNPPYALLHPNWMHIYVSSILLDVVKGENTMRVSNGYADFYFAPDAADTTLWVITEWWDRQPAG